MGVGNLAVVVSFLVEVDRAQRGIQGACRFGNGKVFRREGKGDYGVRVQAEVVRPRYGDFDIACPDMGSVLRLAYDLLACRSIVRSFKDVGGGGYVALAHGDKGDIEGGSGVFLFSFHITEGFQGIGFQVVVIEQEGSTLPSHFSSSSHPFCSQDKKGKVS